MPSAASTAGPGDAAPGPGSAARAPGRSEAPRSGPARFPLDLNDAQREALTDEKREEVIVQLQGIADRFDDDSPRKPDLVFELSEAYWEKGRAQYRREMEAADAQPAARAADGAIDHRRSEALRDKAIALAGQILHRWPRYARTDEVLFGLAYNLEDAGRGEEAVKRYGELIARFPRSRFAPDAEIQLGNYAFDHNDLGTATSHYRRAFASDVPKIRNYALYKLAWCDYNGGDLRAARDKLTRVVAGAEGGNKELLDLRNESLADLVRVFVGLDAADDAMAYFRAQTRDRQRLRLTTRLGDAFAEAGRFENALRVYRALLATAPNETLAPQWQRAVVRCFDGMGDRAQVKLEVRRLADLYRPGSAWWKAHADAPGVRHEGFELAEEAMRNLATEYHQEAQKTRAVETYRLARDIYAAYVHAFASSRDTGEVADQAFDMRFYYAEVLWTLEEWGRAAEQYDAVVAFRIPDRASAREVSDEKYRITAAYDAVLAYGKLLEQERGRLGASKLENGQKISASRRTGSAPAEPHLGKDASRAPRPLTTAEEKLIAACDRYVSTLPGAKDEVDVRYQAAVVLYEGNHFEEAIRRFGEIISRWPEERRSQQAADLALATLEARGDWKQLMTLSQRFLDDKRLAQPGTDFAARVARVAQGARYKWVSEVLYKRERKGAAAAAEFESFVHDFPASSHADQALTYAMVVYRDAHQLERAVAVGERVLSEYPASPLRLKIRYTLAHLYEQLAEFQKAAEMYEAFAASFERTKESLRKTKTAQPEEAALLKEAEPWVPDALFNAGVLWGGLQRTDRAVAAYRSYMKRFKDRPDVPEVAYAIGRLQEAQSHWVEAARTYREFASRFDGDPRTTAARRYLALHRAMLCEERASSVTEAAGLRWQLLALYRHLPESSQKDPEVSAAYGEVRFRAVEPLWKRYQTIRFDRVRSAQADLAAKQASLKQLEAAYTEVIATGAAAPGIAALTRVGLSYANFADAIRASPTPPGLKGEQKQLYRDQLETLAAPLEGKAVEALETALSKSYELAVYDAFTLKAQEQVDRYRPGSYPPVRSAGPRGEDEGVSGRLVAPAAAPPGVAVSGAGASAEVRR